MLLRDDDDDDDKETSVYRRCDIIPQASKRSREGQLSPPPPKRATVSSDNSLLRQNDAVNRRGVYSDMYNGRVYTYIHCESKKGTSILLPATLADVDGFSKFLHC